MEPFRTAAVRRLRGRRSLAPLAVSLIAAIGLAACASSSATTGPGGSVATARGGKSLALVAYSVPKPAYDALQKGFAGTSEGSGVTWRSSYGASGDQSRAVQNG